LIIDVPPPRGWSHSFFNQIDNWSRWFGHVSTPGWLMLPLFSIINR
jgi:hypothetical protein